jgi:poly(3-hydroxyalkanoate) depolymerase
VTGRVRRIDVLGHDVRVSVRHGTDPGRRPLVLCNGIGASLDLLQPFAAALPADIEVVSFDAPGVGGSARPRVPYNIPMLAAFLGAILDRLGYGDVDVLGISWGGALAQQFAFQNPRRCRRLVLVSTATGVLMVPARPSVLRKMATPRRYRDPAYAESIAAELYGGALRARPEIARQLLSVERLGPPGGYLLQMLAGTGWTSLPLLPFVRQPTLVLAGRDDPIIRLGNARVLTALLPHARLHVFDDGHLGLVTMADELALLVAAFLRET